MKSRFENKGVPLSDFSTPAITNLTNLNKFVEYITTSNWIDATFFGDYSKWVVNILYFPFDLSYNSDTNYVAKLSSKTTTVVIKKVADDLSQGVYMGGINTSGIITDGFLSYEPYTKCRMWLPYHSFIELPMKSFSTYMSIYIVLKLDFLTGRASYYIYGCNVVLPTRYTDGTIIYATDIEENINNNSTLISKIDFTIAYELPIGTTGSADRIRNMTLRTFDFIGDVTSVIATHGLTAPSATVKTIKKLNPKTQRLRTVKKVEQTYTPIDHTKMDVVNAAFNFSTDVLKYATLNPSSTVSDNANLSNILPSKIYLVFERINTLPKNDEFKHLFGLPLAEVKQLKDLSGYTEISNIHLEGFKYASSEELSLIEQSLYDGFIL